MVGAVGFETKKGLERIVHSERQDEPEALQNQGIKSKALQECDGTETHLEPANEHNRHITGYITDSDLKSLVDVWPDLSVKAKKKIMDIIVKAKRGQ